MLLRKKGAKNNLKIKDFNFFLREEQIELFKISRYNYFIKSQVENLKEKQEDKIQNLSDKEITNLVEKIYLWANKNGIESFAGIEYFINLNVKYQVFEKSLNEDKDIIDIFSYPDRTEEDLLFLFHHYLKFNYIYDEE